MASVWIDPIRSLNKFQMSWEDKWREGNLGRECLSLSLSLYAKLNILSLSQHLKIAWGPEVTPTPQTITTHGIL